MVSFSHWTLLSREEKSLVTRAVGCWVDVLEERKFCLLPCHGPLRLPLAYILYELKKLGAGPRDGQGRLLQEKTPLGMNTNAGNSWFLRFVFVLFERKSVHKITSILNIEPEEQIQQNRSRQQINTKILGLYLYIYPSAWHYGSNRLWSPEGPATGHLGTAFLGFPVSVYKQMLRWFPVLQVATACFSCSPPGFKFLVPFHNCVRVQNCCHRATAQLQLINYYYYYYKLL